MLLVSHSAIGSDEQDVMLIGIVLDVCLQQKIQLPTPNLGEL